MLFQFKESLFYLMGSKDGNPDSLVQRKNTGLILLVCVFTVEQ